MLRALRVGILLVSFAAFLGLPASHTCLAAEDWIRTAKSGPWSAGATWEGGAVPGAGARVHVLAGHRVTYDVDSDAALRALSISGVVTFARQQPTRLDVGVLKIQPGDAPSEEGFDCDAHDAEKHDHASMPALEVGTPTDPVTSTARIRLVYFEGHDRQSCPAIVACAGRMDFHGRPLSATWTKLGRTVRKGEKTVTLSVATQGWNKGDRVLLTATKLGRDAGQGTDLLQTEDRTIESIDQDGRVLTLDRPLDHDHRGEGDFRGEVANLSRNVIVESADPKGVRGHTMYHRGSAGSISYAEFRHLGKKDTLGRYALHYHQVGDTMRGSSVRGASIHDSHNRWLTVHGTNHLVVRDCIGFRSVGHGFYLEDGTEVDNVFDHNLAIQAMNGRKLPKQVLPFDHNEGSGFWWANSRNTFTNNVTCENDRYGYRFEATETSAMKMQLPIRQPDGEFKTEDIRALLFVRFADNEAHCDGLYGINLGEGVNRVGPTAEHPFVLARTKIWEVHYAFRVQSPCVSVQEMRMHNAIYGVYHPNFDRHEYRRMTISRSADNGGDAEPFNRGHDDDSIQHGTLVVDGLTFAGHRNSGMPLIQITDHNPTGTAESHFRGVTVEGRRDDERRALVNRGGGPRPNPKSPTSVPIILHDWYGPGRHAKVVSIKSADFAKAPEGTYRSEPPLTGDDSRVTEVRGTTFPTLLNPQDTNPPTTVITDVRKTADGWVVKGTATDDLGVAKVVVNDVEATSDDGFLQWRVTLKTIDPKCPEITAFAIDAAGKTEPRPHTLPVTLDAN